MGVLKQKSTKQLLLGAVGVLAFGAALGWGWSYLSNGRFLEATNDAYVRADFTTIAPKVSGYIADVAVSDNEQVKAGQVLARIDDRDFRTALDQASADVASAEADIRNLDAQLSLQAALVDQAQADIKASEAGAAFAKQDAARYRDLLKTGYGTVQRAQQANANWQQLQAELERSRAALVAAQQQIAVLQAQRAKADTQLDHVKAAKAQAELNLGYTTIRAPIEGTIGARQLRTGQYVQAGTALMAVVPLKAVYVVANFKETQLARVASGEPVKVRVDSFPGQLVHGRVDSLAPASGLEFALLPPDNATGNFTKIVQRIPVRIAIDPNDPLAGKLRAGMSVEATINTKPGAAAPMESHTAVAAR